MYVGLGVGREGRDASDVSHSASHKRFISNEPLIVVADNVFTPDECDAVLAQEVPFAHATGWDFKAKRATQTSYRTSSLWYDNSQALITWPDRLMAQFPYLQAMGRRHFERGVRQRYTPGQSYQKHCDFFGYPNTPPVANDRVATCIIYLNDGFEGGDTFFNLLEISVTPTKGSVLYFQYDYTYESNLLTQHTGMSVTAGEKQIVTFWIRALPTESGY